MERAGGVVFSQPSVLAGGHIVHEILDIVPLDRGDGYPLEQGDYVPCDAATVGNQYCFLLGDLSPSQPPASFNIGEVLLAKRGDHDRLLAGDLAGHRISTLDHLAQDPSSILPRHLGRRAIRACQSNWAKAPASLPG
jgi:hypothetical protein